MSPLSFQYFSRAGRLVLGSALTFLGLALAGMGRPGTLPQVEAASVVERCPVSGMAIREPRTAPKGIHQNKLKYFCCDTCRIAFSRNKARSTSNIEQVGELPLAGQTADIWAYKGYAYVGSRGEGIDSPMWGPYLGVRIISLADPAHPKLTGAVAQIPGTSQEKVIVRHVTTPAYDGDLLVTGIQAMDPDSSAPRGIELWDVSDPTHPVHLAFWASGVFGKPNWRGVHELYLFQQGDHAYIAAACPYSEPRTGVGDFRLVDVTDPRNPVQVSTWGIRQDGGFTEKGKQDFFVHSCWTNAAGTLALLSGWDAGAIFLDISDPAHPRYVGRTKFPIASINQTHSTNLAQGESVLLTTSEILHPGTGQNWGPLRFWDFRNPAQPQLLSTFNTADSRKRGNAKGGIYTVHNAVVRGNTAYMSWYSDGVRVLDISNPRAAKETAAFVPPNTVVWGVTEMDGNILASDINFGLYVLRMKP